ncbi:hypothetical protein Bca52824_059393 [Brassica carinata]|uniref:Uncharacterized protein n=1 Tax=Brassica carinata TaxID=52824 RepID=A0A8X7QWG4_BRACI|nr:hypothetical protein Bca52824_059393 [Brassica carinata]
MSLYLSFLILFRFIKLSSLLSLSPSHRHTIAPSHRHIVTPSHHYLCSSSPSHNYLTSAQSHRHVVTSSLLQLTVPLLQLAFISVNGEEEDSRRRRKRGEKE